MSTSGFDQDRLAVMHDKMASHAGSESLPGLVTLISRGGETDLQAYGTMTTGGDTPMRDDAIFRIASVTKPMVAVAAMALVEDATLRLDDPVDPFLPELANRQVLRSMESDLSDTVPANRPITLRDLLTLTPGYGAIFAAPGTYPIQQAMDDAGLSPGPNSPAMTADEMLRRYADLPLVAQPGTRWLYNNGSDILGILLARASEGTLGELLQERVFGPLGMVDTAFAVPADKVDRLPGAYFRNPATGEVMEFDVAGGESTFASKPLFESGAGGLVSTAADLLAFSEMMLGSGTRGDVRVLSRASVALMTTNQIRPEQAHAADFFPGFWDTHGWGFGLGIDTARAELFMTPGRYGWDGGFGTSLNVDPTEDVIGILLTQQLWDGVSLPKVHLDFWNGAYQALA
jgi:CubicO group peptidase (beta-lactamase class C family)